MSLHFAGKLQTERNHLDQAVRFLRQARALQEDVVQANPDNLHYCTDLAATLHQLGKALARTGRLAPARTVLRPAIDHPALASARAPRVSSYRADLGTYHQALAEVLAREDRPDGWLRALNRSRALREELAEADPRSVRGQSELAVLYFSLAVLHHQRKEREA